MQQTTKHPLQKIFWGHFSYHGTGPLVSVDGVINGVKYIQAVMTRIVPGFKMLGVPGNAFLTRSHTMPCIQESEEIFI
jgi:hypothetical protein